MTIFQGWRRSGPLHASKGENDVRGRVCKTEGPRIVRRGDDKRALHIVSGVLRSDMSPLAFFTRAAALTLPL